MNSLQRYIIELKNANVSKKISIIKILSTSKKEQVIEILLECLKDPSPGVRIAALQALEKLNFFDEEVLLNLCHDNSKTIRKIALKILSAKPKAEYLKKCNGLLMDSDKTVRLEALHLLFKIGKESIPLLQKALKDEDELIRNKAMNYIKILEPEEKILDEKKFDKTDKIISGFKGPRILGNFTPVSEKQNILPYQEKLSVITEKLSKKKIEDLDYFISLLEDKSWTIREFAIEKINELHNIDFNKIYDLLKHPIWYVRAAAVRILGLKKDEKLIDLLMPLIKDSNVEVRRSIAEALGKLAREDTLLQLEHLLKDKSIMVRREAEKSIVAIKKKKGF